MAEISKQTPVPVLLPANKSRAPARRKQPPRRPETGKDDESTQRERSPLRGNIFDDFA